MKLWNSSWGKKAPGCSRGARSLGTRLALESLENRYLLSAGFLQTNLISDLAGIARFTDSHLSNAWGIDYLPGGPFWIADNNPGLAGVVDGGGQPVALTYLGGNTATIPASVSGTPGSPTGVVANISSDFSAAGTTTGPSEFIFATEDGLLVSWNPGDGTQGVVAVNHSATADYTGLALGANSSGNFLYVANIKAGTIDVFDKNFAATTLSGNFTDPMLPAGYRPFNIQNIGGRLLVAYVLYDPLTNRGVPGAGNGVIDEFDTSGKFLARLVSNGTGSPLNAPWAFALAPANFGPFSNALLVGNFGDGHISAFNSANGTFLGQLSDPSGKPIAIDKLWGLKFGNGGSAGDPATLYFAAGIQNETHGLFGWLRNRMDDIAGRVLSTGQWWVGKSNGSAFATTLWTMWNPNVTWVDVQTGDFNGDGQMDIAGRVLETGQWWVATSNGSSFATTLWTTWNPNVNWVDVKVGNFNGDGKMDIVGRVQETGQWWVAQSTGSSFMNSLWATWNPMANWVDVNVGDFDGNGKADITGRVMQSGQWWTGLSTGSSFSTSLWTTWNPAASWVDVRVGDFTGDGKADIAGRVLQSGQWWIGASTGSSFANSLWTTWNPMVTWADVMVGDFNGDGKMDIVGRVLQSGQWWVGVSNGSAFSSALWATWNPNVTWVDVQVGDFNGDGKADITGRVLQSGQWSTGVSSGSAFMTSVWDTWSPSVTWVDVHHADYT
ncbi:MAG TPA: TIGR03118 family protein [Gemmataceae bacterium]|nr:TIGR03118 family protein [Gemmataceae bacterium]